MTVGLFNPKDTANSTASRPAHVNTGLGVRRWFQVGTRLASQDLNALMAQFRTALDYHQFTDSEGDDTLLQQLIVHAARRRNAVRNSSFDVWLDGTSFTTEARMGLWQKSSTAGRTYSRQAGFAGARYCLRVQRDSGNATTTQIRLAHTLSPEISYQYAGRTVRISADVRGGADLSDTSIGARLTSGTGVEETFTLGSLSFPTGNSNNSAGSQTAVIGGSGSRLVWSAITIPSSATELALVFLWSPAGTAGAADYWEITNIFVEDSPVATTYTPDPYVVSLDSFMRQYQKSFREGTTPAQNVGFNTGEYQWHGSPGGAGAALLSPRVPLLVPMRSNSPTVTLYNPAAANAQVRDLVALADCSASIATNLGNNGFNISCTTNASSTLASMFGVHWTADARL